MTAQLEKEAGEGIGDMRGHAVVGVDVGGTNTVIGLFEPSPERPLELKAKAAMRTANPSGGYEPGLFFDRLAREIEQLFARHRHGSGSIRMIGMGVPGWVDTEAGVALGASNLQWKRVPVAAEMAGRLGAPVIIDNDVRMYTYGEALAGAGQGKRDLVCLTLGTGLAAGVMAEGRLLRGSRRFAGEIGHDRVEGNEARCNCGTVGCLETIASASGIARLANEAVQRGEPTSIARIAGPRPATAADVHEACVQGDAFARRLFVYVAETLARKLLTVSMTLDPEMIIVGGGVAAAGNVLLDPMRRVFAAHYERTGFVPEVTAGRLGEEAGLIGSAHFAVASGEGAFMERGKAR